MEQTYKYSYKVGDNLLSSLSVYNVGYQQCGPEQQWGPGIRDHYCIHHIISGKGTYVADKKVYHLGQKIRVRVADADAVKRSVDFTIAEEQEE